MPILQFRSEFIEPILAGQKTATTRAKPPRMSSDNPILTMANGYRPNAVFARAKITDVIELTGFDVITDSIARRDGFASRETMINVLQSCSYDEGPLWVVFWDFASLVVDISFRALTPPPKTDGRRGS